MTEAAPAASHGIPPPRPDFTALQKRLLAPGSKAILSLDGGGTRGIVTLAFLDRIEAVLCGDDPQARLCDHFDLIGGTSTGAIIAAALALGWRVADTQALRRIWPSRLHPALVSAVAAGQSL